MRKGFTLIEILGVISLVAILGLIVVPIVIDVVDNSKLKARNTQIDMIIETSRNWASENIRLIPEDPEEPYYLPLEDLRKSKYLDGSIIIDPYTGLEMNGCIEIKYVVDYKQYKYKYTDCP